MANLLGQNIGTNYKGILNLNTLNGNLTTTLEAITDGDGNASTLLLSTTLARVSSNLTIGGSTTASARLHVRGDGTNPVGRFENSSGNAYFQVNTNGSVFILGNAATDTFRIQENQLINVSSGTITGISYTMSGSFAAGAGSANFRPLAIAYTINNSGAQTGTATGIFLNATETALNGMGHNLIDLQVGGSSRFRVNNVGSLILSGSISSLDFVQTDEGSPFRFGTSRSRIYSNADGNLRLSNAAQSGFNLLQLGGTTNAFPAIKRNGANIDFRFADDSTFCNIRAGRLDLTGALLTGFINDATNAITAISIANTTGKTTFSAPLAATALPTTRPATVGDLYVDTAANILANGDKVVGIRV